MKKMNKIIWRKDLFILKIQKIRSIFPMATSV